MKRILSLFLALALCAALTVPALGAGFTDVPSNYPFLDAIQDCTSKGILSGYSDGTFRPGKSVTRAQFCMMLARAFYPEELKKNANLASSGWFVPAAAALDSQGASVYSNDYWYDPAVMNVNISRNDMARFIAAVMKAKGYSVSKEALDAAQAKITDYSSISESFQEPVKTVFALGIITGYADGSFSGSKSMNRGQAAVIIYRMTQCLSGKPGMLTPVQQEDTPAPTTLTNGKAVTEENVLAMMEELKTEYPEDYNFAAGYPLGESSPVRLGTYPYLRREDPATHTSNTLGCGGWATLASDAMLGQEGFPVRKTTLENARPGDIMIQLEDGLLVHVAMISQRPSQEDGAFRFNVTEAATDDQGVYHIHWDSAYYWNPASSKYTYDIWTRYPN